MLYQEVSTEAKISKNYVYSNIFVYTSTVRKKADVHALFCWQQSPWKRWDSLVVFLSKEVWKTSFLPIWTDYYNDNLSKQYWKVSKSETFAVKWFSWGMEQESQKS